MNCGYLANFGNQLVDTNGQVTKSIHFKDVLIRVFEDVQLYNSYNANFYEIYKFTRSNHEHKFVSLGRKGLLIFFICALFFVRPQQKIWVVAVGGWMPSFLRKVYVRCVRNFCNFDVVFLVETFGLRDELINLGEVSHYYPNVRATSSFDLDNLESVYSHDPSFRFVFLSRMIPEKGAICAINAVRYLHKHGIPGTLDIYGSGDNEFVAHINDIIANDPYISFLGPVDHRDVGKVFLNYDALILPTFYPGECMPGVVVEALESGVISITSDHKYLPEIIEHLGYGFALPLDSFHVKFLHLILNGKITKRSLELHSEMHKRFVDCFSLEAGVSKLRDILIA